MDDRSELRALRERLADLQRQLDRVPPPDPSSHVTQVFQTVKVKTYPTAAGAFYALTPVDLSGTEVEGGTATLSPRASASRIDYGFNIGASIPPVGTFLKGTKQDGFWVIQYG